VIHPTSRPPKRDEATILLALCEEPARIVPNWRIVDNDGHDIAFGQPLKPSS